MSGSKFEAFRSTAVLRDGRQWSGCSLVSVTQVSQ